MQQKRLDYLDMAKGIGIFLVILGHIEYIQEDTLKWLSSFHMPLFFVVGGILVYLRRDTGRTAFETIGSRIRGVLTPYLSFSLMLLTMNTITSIRNPETRVRVASGHARMAAESGNYPAGPWRLRPFRRTGA